MASLLSRSIRIPLLAGLVLALLLLIPVRSIRSQVSGVTVNLSCPVTASAGATTRASLDFSLPVGCSLLYPQIRVTSNQLKLCELLPAYIDSRSGGLAQPLTGRGHRDMNTGNYRAGVSYRVCAEILYRDLTGAKKVATSAATTMAVPSR